MKLLNSKVFTVLIGIIVFWLILSSINLNSQKNMINMEVKNMKLKIKEVQDDTNYLSKFLAYFQTSNFLEKEARSKLNYKAQGEEVVFIFKDKNTKKESEAVSFDELLRRMPKYKKWLLYILGY